MDDETPQPPPPIPVWGQQLLKQQKRTAQSIADLALVLEQQARQARERHDEHMSISLALLTERRSAPAEQRPRRNSDDLTDRFRLPGDSGVVELSRRTQRRILGWVILALVIAATHVAQFLLTRMLR